MGSILKLFSLIFLIVCFSAQPALAQSDSRLGNLSNANLGTAGHSIPLQSSRSSLFEDLLSDSVNAEPRKYPDPNQVMFKSLMIPGWGQVINNQVWKVPLVYALMGGLTYYSIYLNKRYHDYRAAYYNLTHEEVSDRPYGPTPGYLQPVTSSRSLQTNRNYYRNRRDFIYITIGLAYGLNAIDAYVFAHMRSFDVSDDLSIRSNFTPDIQQNTPVLTLRLELASD
jgi:hypothetical protein